MRRSRGWVRRVSVAVATCGAVLVPTVAVHADAHGAPYVVNVDCWDAARRLCFVRYSNGDIIIRFIPS